MCKVREKTQADYDAFEAEIKRRRTAVPAGCPTPALIRYAVEADRRRSDHEDYWADNTTGVYDHVRTYIFGHDSGRSPRRARGTSSRAALASRPGGGQPVRAVDAWHLDRHVWRQREDPDHRRHVFPHQLSRRRELEEPTFQPLDRQGVPVRQALRPGHEGTEEGKGQATGARGVVAEDDRARRGIEFHDAGEATELRGIPRLAPVIEGEHV